MHNSTQAAVPVHCTVLVVCFFFYFSLQTSITPMHVTTKIYDICKVNILRIRAFAHTLQALNDFFLLPIKSKFE
jgi:hypothetical protein